LITAHSTKRYEQIIRNTVAIAFIGTPHRGADLAKILKGLLKVTFSEAKIVDDLSPSSQSIKDINDSFGERSKEIELASFWESRGKPLVGIIPEILHADIGQLGCGSRIFGNIRISRRN
jgi:hypothetical protein